MYSDTSSPYRESRINSFARPKVRRHRTPHSGPTQSGPVMGHIWHVDKRWTSMREICRFCKQPRFTIEWTRCLASKFSI